MNSPSSPDSMTPRRALLSVSDKTGVIPFAQALAALGIEILSTGGTHKLPRQQAVHRVQRGVGLHRLSGDDGRPRKDAASEACTAASSGAVARTTRSPRPMASTPIDLVVVNLYPFAADHGPPRLRPGDGDREHRHRRPDDDPLGSQEPSSMSPSWSSRRTMNALSSSELKTCGRQPERRDALRPCREGLRSTPPAMTSAIANYLGALDEGARGECFPRSVQPAVRQGRRTDALRRKPAPGARPSTVSATGARRASATARQLQGKELSYNNIADTDAALECVKQLPATPGLRDRQTCQPLRRRGGRHGARGLRTGVSATDTDLGLWRHHRLQPRAGRRDCASADHRTAVRRGDHRAGGERRRRCRVLAAKTQCAPAGLRRAGVKRRSRARLQARAPVACWCRSADLRWSARPSCAW
jgi:hypothetical protein